MAHANDSWLDRLDIPDIPDFASPTFNPYVYDGADEWFNTHRETCTRSQMAMVSSQVKYQVAETSQTEISVQQNVLPPRSHSSRSHQENSGPTGPTLAVPKRSIRIPFMTAKPNRIIPAKNAAFHTVAKMAQIFPKPAAHVVPMPRTEDTKTAAKMRPLPAEDIKTMARVQALPTAVKRFHIPVRIPIPANNKPPAEHHVPLMKKSQELSSHHGASFHRATATTAANNLPRPTSNISLLRRRSDEMDGIPKRRSVVAARAGEYFAHILRAYPTEIVKGRVNPGWK